MITTMMVVEFLSWLVFGHPGAANLACLAVILATFIVGWLNPPWLAYIGMGELIIGSKGYLLSVSYGGHVMSLRIVLFVATVILVALLAWRRRITFFWKTPLSIPLISLMLWLGLAAVWGLAQGHQTLDVFLDLNAFGYIGLWWCWWSLLKNDPHKASMITMVVLSGVTIVGIKSWLMVVLFGQPLDNWSGLYHWIRDTGVGEITKISANYYRVFFQSQIFGLYVLLTAWMLAIQNRSRWIWWAATISALAIIISLSRSFWLGVVGGLMTILFIVGQNKWWTKLKHLWMVIPTAVLAIGLFFWAVNFPYPWTIGSSAGRGNAVVTRLKSAGSAAAFTARQNQIQPLLQAIAVNPVIGRGFGQEVSFFSTDPRIKGWRTTTAFELGYLDLWLKIGLIGLGLMTWWIIKILLRLSHTKWIILIPSVIALGVVNATTPYLNHPLGLGWLLMVGLLAYE